MNLFTGIFVLFLIIYIGVSLWSGRHGVTLGEYYNNNADTSHWLVAGTYAATWISAVGLISLAGMSYKTGVLSGVWDWGAYIGFVLSAFWIGNKLRNYNGVTTNDFLGDRYNSQAVRVIGAVVTFLGIGAYFISGIIGSAVLCETLLGIPYEFMVWGMVAMFVFIALVSGSKSATITNTIMLAIIVVALGYIFSPLLISKVGARKFEEFAKANPVYFTAGGGVYTWGTIIGWQFLWGFGNAANPSAISRCFLARDARSWVKAMIISMMVTMSCIWLSYIASSSVMVAGYSDISGSALTWAAMNMVPKFIGAFAIAGLFGACLSTASSQILTLSFSFTRDIYQKVINPKASDKTLLLMARVCVVIFGVIGGLLATGGSSQIIAIGNFGSSVFAAAFFFPLFLGLNWRRFSKKAALGTMIVGLIVNTFMYIILPAIKGLPMASVACVPFGMHPTLFAIIIDFLAAIVLGFAFDSTAEEKAVYDQCNKRPENAEAVTPAASVRKYAYVLLAYAIVQTALLLWFATIVA